MSWLQAILLAILQGVTELFPVSSLGHAVVVPDLLNWPVDERSEAFLPFLVVMHFGTAVALLLYFWRDWYDFTMAALFNQGVNPAAERRLLLRVVVATVPAVIVATVLEKHIRDLFAAPLIVSAFLVVNGVMLFAVERMKPATAHKAIGQMTWLDAAIIGCCLCCLCHRCNSRVGKKSSDDRWHCPGLHNCLFTSREESDVAKSHAGYLCNRDDSDMST